MMRFSILLPTRNRLDLLKMAVQSVLDQGFTDWEIVVSDNASEEDVRGFVTGLEDSRIKYLRTDELLTVTENWNRALEHSSGEYVIMLGDDDALMKDCLKTADELLVRHDEPELLYNEAILFAYPGVLPAWKQGCVQFAYAGFLHGQTDPFWLPRDEALGAVEDSINFRVSFPYNMQYSIVSRRLVEKLAEKGPFYQSPYPDYYAANAMFLVADRILVCPWPLVAVGISPKSFGYYFFNDRETEGIDFLHNVPDERLVDGVRSVMLPSSDAMNTVPGSEMTNAWLLSVEALVRSYGADYGLEKVLWKYRFTQFRMLFRKMRPVKRLVATIWQLGDWREKAFWLAFLGYAAVLKLFLPFDSAARIREHALDLVHESHPWWTDGEPWVLPYSNILDFVRAENGRSLAESGAPWLKKA